MIRAFLFANICVLCAFGHSFEVASVKVNTTGERPTGDAKGDKLTMYNMPMKVLVARAFQVANDRIIGPGWMDTEGYDIVAKIPAGTSGPDALWLMLKNLLIERFRLEVHHDQTPMPVYALVIGKSGPKLKEPVIEYVRKPECVREGTQLTCQEHKMTMAQLVEQFPRWMPRDWFGMPVVDQTGLSGVYDISITWTLTDRRDEANEPAVSFFDALQDQLGLKLEQRKTPVDRIVIDHIERVPTEN
jgi:uncharacterized protein (TIGR03435 family)